MKGQVLGKQMNDFLPHCRRPARSEAKRNNVKIQKLSDVPFAVPQAFRRNPGALLTETPLNLVPVLREIR
jgi:hypothetical protein